MPNSHLFSDLRWTIRLFSDGSLIVQDRCSDRSGECGDYESVIDFLQEQHAVLQRCALEHPINQLANFLNYPLCLFEDMLETEGDNSTKEKAPTIRGAFLCE